MDTIPEGYQPCPFGEVFRQLNVTRLDVVYVFVLFYHFKK